MGTAITGIKFAPAAAALVVTTSLLLAACAGGGGGTTPAPIVPAPTPSPTAGPTSNPLAFTCPASGAPNAITRSGGSGAEATTRMFVRLPAAGSQPTRTTTLLAVSYARTAVAANLQQIAAREQALGASFVRSYDYPQQNLALRVVSVPTASLATAEAALRAQAGVQSIGITGQRRFRTTSNAFYTNDPYFQGFAPNNEALPYAESSSVPGQWDMHAIGLEHAYGYSQLAGNTAPGGANANALGSSTIKIAIIDTGEDASHPELAPKIGYQKCFVTNAAGTSQSTGSFSTDEDGHGTDVSGIAAAASGNSLGFSGAGGKATIYAYRVFPTPDDNCTNSNTNDAQCTADTADIAAAINDAVAKNVNIISMSLGGGSCNGGVDTDPTENAAIVAAIAAHVIVVAAAGNAGGASVDAPACAASVIAVGATSLDDGVTTGTSSYTTNVSLASAAHPVEYVPSYSQYGSAGNFYKQSSAWGIVAPGGDPSNAEISGTADDLHWIENIWTTTPYMSSGSDTAFQGECTNDFPNSTLTTNIDCRTLIAGTSMATPHVAGAAALILAVNPTYGTPTAMKALLCSTADDLGDTHEGCGRLNVYRAMAMALGDLSPPP